MPGGRNSGRGGRRRATPGKAYANRTDLGERRPLPVMTGPSQGYGQRVAQERAQQAVPMGPPPAPPPAPAAPPVPAGPAPGERGDPLRPTERPAEPLTAGIDSGPGPGSEVLEPPDGPDPDLLPMRDYLPTLELLANQPGSSVAVRNFVRRIRGAMPVDAPQPQLGEPPS